MDARKDVPHLRLSSKQQECVDYVGHDQLIRGVPGSGKTIVLLARARKLAQQPDTTVLLFTYNKTLAKFARDHLHQNVACSNIEVIHFHRWAMRKLRQIGDQSQLIHSSDRRKAILQAIATRQAIGQTPSKVLAREMNWWEEEIQWIKGLYIQDWATYEQAERKGRGSALQKRDRQIAWDVYKLYQLSLQRMNGIDFDDFAALLLRFWNPIPNEQQVDYVLVDEAQDLHFAQLLLLRRLARKGITIAADEHQKIYKTTFAWKDLGINVRGNSSKRLTASFRSTRQIITLAACLRRHDALFETEDQDVDNYDLPERNGPLPVVLIAHNQLEEERLLLQILQTERTASNRVTIGVLARTWDQLDRLQRHLANAGQTSELIREEEGSVVTPGVKLTTFHSAKGLEFDSVVLVGIQEGVIPLVSQANKEDRADNEEAQDDSLDLERRLLYVSMTRTRHALYVLSSAPVSRFIDEFDTDLFVSSLSR